MQLILLPNPYIQQQWPRINESTSHRQTCFLKLLSVYTLLNFYTSIVQVSSFRGFYLQILICKINYNTSEQISCSYFIDYLFLYYCLYSMHMLWQIMHDSLITALHVFCFMFSRGLSIFTCMENIMGFMRFMSDAAILHLHFPHGYT